MPDQFTQTTNVGLGSRLMNSIKGVLVGLLLFVVSFGVLYWNEGRAGRAAKLVKQAMQAPVVDATNVDQSAQGKLVAARGAIKTTETLSDSVTVPGTSELVQVKAGNYLKLSRQAEMFAWKETSKTETQKNTGGSETQNITYSYTKEWVAEPANSAEFKIPEGHENPAMGVPSNDTTVTVATLGNLTLDMTSLGLPGSDALVLTSSSVAYPTPLLAQAGTSEFVFLGKGTLASPQVGDVRVHYGYVPANIQVTTFGKLDGTNLSSFVDQKNGSLYRAFKGTKDEAIATMKSENSTMTWILRLVGFIMMWVGLSMFFGPISTFLDILPIAGSISRGLIGAVTFIVAAVLSIVTIAVSMILHNIIAVLVAVAVAAGVSVFLVKKYMKKGKAATA
ncbi:MAG: hypothetical protein EXS55_01135 [Candidatus Magasanikbacteria bacterium]|nr:hypothetical protein [Candidatus Magasanikbacteria bacterium]